ncbi:CGNR zinc finger domain-containing protein [Fredinandcohnia humi]
MDIEEVGGSLWVHLLNTRRIKDGKTIDVLEDLDRMSDWLTFYQIEMSADKEEQRKSLLILRDILIRLVDNFSTNAPLPELNEFLQSKPTYWNIDLQEGQLVRSMKAVNPAYNGLITIIQDFFDTIDTFDLQRVRQCAHGECILYFLDSSKGGRRRWCDMEKCGNKHKASKHYQKVKAKRGARDENQ